MLIIMVDDDCLDDYGDYFDAYYVDDEDEDVDYYG
jgi:hypothetical protein